MNITGKYLKVWKKQEQNGFIKLDLGDSTKQKDGTYHNFTWFGCALMGKAKDVQINEGDVVEIKSGIVEQNKFNDKWYTNIKIFELEVTGKGKATKPDQVDEFVPIDDDLQSDLPF